MKYVDVLCDHSYGTSLLVLLHGMICFTCTIFYKIKLRIFLEF